MTIERKEDAPMVCHGWCVSEPAIAFTSLEAATTHAETSGHEVTMTCTFVWRLVKTET